MADDLNPKRDARQNEFDNFALNENGKIVRRVEDEALINTLVQDLVLGRDYDNGEVQYPNNTTEIYIFKLGTTVLRTITLVYTNNSKQDLSTWSAS